MFQIATHRRTDCQLIPETGASTRGDLLLAHYDKIEKDYNCDIDIFAAEDPVNRILLSVSSDFKYADICEEWLTTLYKLIKAEMLVPLSYFECFDDDLFSGKYGLTNFIEATKIKGEYYGFYPGYWGLPTQQFAAVLYFNQDYINQAGVENPQEHYEKDDWTWATFEDMLARLVNTDAEGNLCGTINVTANYYALYSAVLANGCKFVNENPDGTYSVDFGDNAIEAMNWWRDLIVRRLVVNDRQNAGWSLDETFMNGEMAFTCQYTYHGTVDTNSFIYNLEARLGWLPFPKGPSATDELCYGTAITHGSRFMFYPKNQNFDERELSEFTNILLSPFEGETGTEWREEFSRSTFYDDKSADIYFAMLENAADVKYELYTRPDFISVQNGSVTPAELVTSTVDNIQAAIDEFFS